MLCCRNLEGHMLRRRSNTKSLGKVYVAEYITIMLQKHVSKAEQAELKNAKLILLPGCIKIKATA